MNKASLHKQIMSALLALHASAVDAVNRAHDTATDEENAPENKYDTLGLEASYLAHGQAQRLLECETDIVALQKLPVTDFSAEKAISLGALVHIEDDQGTVLKLFLSPAAGGLKLDVNGDTLMLVTPSAPLGKALVGHFLDEEIDVQVGAEKKHYLITSIS